MKKILLIIGILISNFSFSQQKNIYYKWNKLGYRDKFLIQNGDTTNLNVIHQRIGFTISSEGQPGINISIGNRLYFIFDINTFLKRDESFFYPGIDTNRSEIWNDKKLKDINKSWNSSFGIGIKFKKIGLHSLVGYYKTDIRYQNFDDLFILSNNGKYSFPKESKANIYIKFGALYDWKNISIISNYNPFIKVVNGGISILF